MTITVVISTWSVPFDQVVNEIKTFTGEKANSEALAFINASSKTWWDENGGDRWVEETKADGKSPKAWTGDSIDGYEPINELGYDTAEYNIWGGEQGFHAMLDQDSYAKLHEAHYKQLGFTPGYLINAYAAGQKPGGSSAAEIEDYKKQQAEGIAAIESTYGKPTKQ